MFVGRNDTCRQFTDEHNMAVDNAVYPCTYGDGFVPYNYTNTDLSRASCCQYCHLDFEKFTKITCVKTNTKQTGIQPKISYCSVQILNWFTCGPQGMAPIIYLIDYHEPCNNGFYFVYETNHVEASLFRCYVCPNLPLHVLRVNVNVRVHRGHTVKFDNLAFDTSMQPKMAYEDYYKDVCCWDNYKTDYNKHMVKIIDELISIQDNLENTNNWNDTALANLVHDSNTTNLNANSDTDCMTEDDLNFCRGAPCNSNSPDVNFPDKKWGFIVTEENVFSFIGPDRPYPVIKSPQDYIQMAHMIKESGVPNYRLARIPIHSDLRIEAWERHLQGYPDTRLIHYLKYGFPLSIKSHDKLPITEVRNHFSAIAHSQAVEEYLTKEISAGAILGPFGIDLAHGIHSSPLLTRPKDVDKRRVILNLSHPSGSSVNDQVDRMRFDGVTFRLRFPSIDNITEEILKIGEGVTLAKVDVSRAFRNLRIDPGDALNFGIQWRGRQYLDAAAAFGWVHGSGAFQMASDAIPFLMAKRGYKMFPYIDDYILVTHRANADDAFQYLVYLLTDLGLPMNPDKLCPPTTSLTCLGITINVEQHTLSIENTKIRAIWQECCSIFNKKYLSRNKFQSLLGKLLYIHKCVRPARIFISRMLSLFRSNHNHNRIHLTPGFFQDLAWFIKFIPSFNGKTYFNKGLPSADYQVFIDASLTGLGGYWNGRAYATPVYSILGFKLGIVHLEMFNILLALRSWAKFWAHQSILIHCDNMAVVQVVRLGKSRDDFLSACLRNVWLLAAAFDIDLHITHIQGCNNTIADALSRMYSDSPTSSDIFQKIGHNCIFHSIPLHYFNLDLSL